MAVFRVEKTNNYTVMSNYHLKDKDLSLKSKGLLSVILSLPSEWEYTTRGLAAISKEGVDSISTALKELENTGYLTRNKLRDERGRITDTEYVIYEYPQANPNMGKPNTLSPDTEKPYTVNPQTENPCTILPAQYNTNQTNPKSVNPNGVNIHQSIATTDKHNTNEAMEIYSDIIKSNIDYEILCERYNRPVDEINEIFEIMLEAICSTKKTIRIGGEDKPTEVVKSRLLKLDFGHIEYVMGCMSNNTTDVRNIKSYLLTTLFNAPVTIGNYYKSRVNHDLAATNQ